GFTFQSCRGMAPRRERFAASDIVRIYYRERASFLRPSRDELVVRVRSRAEPFVIPLSLEPGAIDYAVLARIVPPHVLTPWISSLRERGRVVPEPLRLAPRSALLDAGAPMAA